MLQIPLKCEHLHYFFLQIPVRVGRFCECKMPWPGAAQRAAFAWSPKFGSGQSRVFALAAPQDPNRHYRLSSSGYKRGQSSNRSSVESLPLPFPLASASNRRFSPMAHTHSCFVIAHCHCESCGCPLDASQMPLGCFSIWVDAAWMLSGYCPDASWMPPGCLLDASWMLFDSWMPLGCP